MSIILIHAAMRLPRTTQEPQSQPLIFDVVSRVEVRRGRNDKRDLFMQRRERVTRPAGVPDA